MSSSLEKKIVVIVEDTKEIGQLIKDTLNAETDYQAVVVSDSAHAMEVIRSVKASLIILDVYLPGISGIELHDLLQADQDTRQVPVLFVTAAHRDPKFVNRNFAHYISKPFDLDDLLKRVNEICTTNYRSPTTDPALTGSEKLNVLPSPPEDSTQILPP